MGDSISAGQWFKKAEHYADTISPHTNSIYHLETFKALSLCEEAVFCPSLIGAEAKEDMSIAAQKGACLIQQRKISITTQGLRNRNWDAKSQEYKTFTSY